MTHKRFENRIVLTMKLLGLFALFAGILAVIPAKADELANLPKTESYDFNLARVAVPEFSLSQDIFQTCGLTLKPMFIPKSGQKTGALDFTSLDSFFVSLTEQDRSEPLSARYKFSESMDYAGHDQPELSYSNLLNSPFANYLVRKLTRPFSH